MRWPVYNSRIPSLPYLRIFLAALLLGHGASAQAEDLAALADQLAEKIVSVTGPVNLKVEVTNRSSLSASAVGEVRRGLLAGLASFAAQGNGEAKVLVRVWLSQDLRNYVWIAEIKQGNESSVTMLSAPRLRFNVPAIEGTTLAIHKTLLWSSEDRILDVEEIAEGSWLVLYPEQVTLYRSKAGKLEAEQSWTVTHTQPWPRDLRGRLVPGKDHRFEAYLPGVSCQSSTAGMNCRPSDDPWPLGNEQTPLGGFFTPTRNYFTGVLSPGIGKQRSTTPFYSQASIASLWLLAALDGHIHLLDGSSEQISDWGWGSDIATLHSGCGSGWQVLATARDNSLRAFEMNGREPVAATQDILLDGGVSALWTAADGGSVIAVSRHRESGAYEAFRLTVTCGQ